MKYEIELKRDLPFWVGDKVYRVEKPGNHVDENCLRVFKTICPSCNDTRRITYKGYDGKEYTCVCPICNNSSYTDFRNELVLYNWEINEYIINSVKLEAPLNKSAYRGGVPPLVCTGLKGFCRHSRVSDDYSEISICPTIIKVDKDIKDINLGNFCSLDSYVFTVRNKAEALQRELKLRDSKKLLDYNRIYNTNHKYPF